MRMSESKKAAYQALLDMKEFYGSDFIFDEKIENTLHTTREKAIKDINSQQPAQPTCA